jgi:polysaccharide deacetylase 2 family uncharacterized protein YibQ
MPQAKTPRNGKRRRAGGKKSRFRLPLLKALGAVAVLSAIVLAAVVVARFLPPPEPRSALTERKKPALKAETPPARPRPPETRPADKPSAARAPVSPAPDEKPASSRPPAYEVFPEKPLAPRNGEPETLHAALPPIPPELPPGRKLPRVAIIIDDLGYDRLIAEKLIGLNAPFTLAILPHSPHQDVIARIAQARGLELMLHLPMEPVEYPDINPGPGTLHTRMGPEELLRVLEEDLDAVAHIKGVNNHMGSRLTASSEQMYQVFSVLKKRGLYFVDSRTTDESVCKPSARLFQLPFAQRDVFIDHQQDTAFIRKQIRELVRVAYRKGEAVGIAHPHPATYTLLKEELPALRQQVEIVPASALVRPAG